MTNESDVASHNAISEWNKQFPMYDEGFPPDCEGNNLLESWGKFPPSVRLKRNIDDDNLEQKKNLKRRFGS
jgi:hypothetical protein